ncbi:MAG: hypothetical protein ACKV2O_02430 [Acidimicrobiales bacterium]
MNTTTKDITLMPPEHTSPRWLRMPLRLLWALAGGLFLMRQVAALATMGGFWFSAWFMVAVGLFGMFVTYRCRVQLVATRRFWRG